MQESRNINHHRHNPPSMRGWVDSLKGRGGEQGEGGIMDGWSRERTRRETTEKKVGEIKEKGENLCYMVGDGD